MRAIAVVALLGCRGEPQRVEHAPSNIARIDSTALARRADEAFAASLAADIGQPFAATAHDREPVRTLYLDACRAGDRRACWLAAAIHPHEADADDVAEALVRDGCRAGDLMSCRAIHRPIAHDDLPGHSGRSCWGTPLAKRLGMHDCTTCSKPCDADLAQLRDECTAGFPLSCRLVSDIDAKHPEPPLSDERVHALERDGCERGVMRDCELWSTRRSRRAALKRLCELVIDRCRDLGEAAYDPDLGGPSDDPVLARDAYERLCQYSPVAERAANCAPLIELYASGVVLESTPGRRDALARWQAGR
jgi:hypothetical protein